MDTDIATIGKPATPEYVLAVIRDRHRQQCRYDPETDPDTELTFETCVADWRYACDLVKWRKLGEALNEEWGLHCSDDEWRAVLEPEFKRTLKDVCDFIAAGAAIPDVRPATVMGRDCLTAGAFRAIREELGKAGVNVSEIAPSTSLHEYARLYPIAFLVQVSRLAPGALPPVEIKEHWANGVCLTGTVIGLMAGWLLCMLSRWVHVLAIPGVICLAGGIACGLAASIAAKQPLRKVRFGDLETFRDLAEVVATALSRKSAG